MTLLDGTERLPWVFRSRLGTQPTAALPKTIRHGSAPVEQARILQEDWPRLTAGTPSGRGYRYRRRVLGADEQWLTERGHVGLPLRSASAVAPPVTVSARSKHGPI